MSTVVLISMLKRNNILLYYIIIETLKFGGLHIVYQCMKLIQFIKFLYLTTLLDTGVEVLMKSRIGCRDFFKSIRLQKVGRTKLSAELTCANATSKSSSAMFSQSL